jgi:hypothetical protein
LTSRTQKLKDRLKSVRRKTLLELIKAGPVASYKKRVQKEKDELAKEGKGLRNIAFFLTLISMTLALSFIPFFPQPLPILVAVLIAFLVYVNPAIGMPIGSVPIVIGLLYHLSTVDFIAMLGSTEVRVLFICLLIFFFVALPIRFRRYEDAIGINLGIIAATLLFFNATYFLAIPLLLTVAILFKKTQAGLAVSYYVLISVPMMLLQYFEHILTIARVDFWNDATAVPPIYVSLSPVFSNIQGSMAQFRMFDVSTTLGKILWNVVEVPGTRLHTVSQAIAQYLDSFPGMILFIVMIAGLVWAVSLILPSFVSKSRTSQAETLFPALSAAGVTALFFLFMAILQVPLAFSAQINSNRMIIGILSSLAFAIPAALLNFAPKKRAEVEKNSQIILVKAGNLMTKLQIFESLLEKVKGNVPVNVSSPETKMEIIKDKLNDILTKAEARKFKVPETYEKIKELDKELADGVNGLPIELNLLLEQYQLTLNYSYVTWIKRLQEVGYEINNPYAITFQKDQFPEERIAYISGVLSASRILANEVCLLAEQVYEVVRTLYDPSLPATNGTISYSKQKIVENTAPWIACDGLITALKNWQKEYVNDISRSVRSLEESLDFLAALGAQKTLQANAGEKYAFISGEIKKAEEIKAQLKKEKVYVLNLPSLEKSLQNSLAVTVNVLSVFREDLIQKEESIESLQPNENGFWEKNVTLREQLTSAIENISDFKTYSLKQMLQNLPQALSYLEPILWTLSQYNTKNELLLNYPIAKTAIDNLFKKKKRISVQDLPFEPGDAEEYLKIYCSERIRDFMFDEENLSLSRKT